MTEESEEQRTPYLGICVHLISSLVNDQRRPTITSKNQQKISASLPSSLLVIARVCGLN